MGAWGKKKYTVASLFSGCGGLDLGFIQAGFEVVFGRTISLRKQSKLIGQILVIILYMVI